MPKIISNRQPICDDCYKKFAPPSERDPVRLVAHNAEVCVNCGERTTSGLFVLLDEPGKAPYPTLHEVKGG